MALGLAQSLIEINTAILPGGKAWSARKVNNPTTIFAPIV
jgi:hypothetical protein